MASDISVHVDPIKCHARAHPADLRLELLATLVLVVFGLLDPAYGQANATRSEAAVLLPAWSKPYANLKLVPTELTWISVALSSNARCSAIAGKGMLEVLGVDGRTLWNWNYGAINRFIVAGPLAVSPMCDQVALAGYSGYKKVWLVDRRGRAKPLSMSSTPLSVAFDRDDKSLAVGTGGNSILLYGVDGKLLWKKIFQPWCCLPTGISFSADNRFLLIREGGAGVLQRDGSVVWTSGAEGMNASRDLQTFVTWAEPNHGPGGGGIAVLDKYGKTIWEKLSDGPSAAITSAGDKIVARVAINQNPTREDLEEPLETNVQVFSRDGSILKVFPHVDGRPVAISPSGDCVVVDSQEGIEGIRLDGKPIFSIGLDHTYFSTVIFAEDFSGALVFSRNLDPQLSWYKLTCEASGPQ